MLYNPFNKKRYCMTRCAKDTFQKWVIDPLLAILVIIAAAIVVVLALVFIGVLSMSLQVLIFQDVIFIEPNVLAQGLLATSTVGLVWVSTYKINTKLNTWVTTKYEHKFRKSCTLLEECT